MFIALSAYVKKEDGSKSMYTSGSDKEQRSKPKATRKEMIKREQWSWKGDGKMNEIWNYVSKIGKGLARLKRQILVSRMKKITFCSY